MNYADQVHAIAALPLLKTKIVIHTDRDLTPKGKRVVRVINMQRGQRYATAKGTQVIRWYVSGKIYRDLQALPENVTLSREWLKAGE